MRGKHRRLPQVCREQGHLWKQKTWGVLGYECCARRSCDEERINPNALPDALAEDDDREAS